MALKRILSLTIMISVMGCSSTPKEATPSSEPAASASSEDSKSSTTTAPAAAPAAPPADADTVDTLTKDVDNMQRELIHKYSGPLTPKQEDEAETLKMKIRKKETKKANMELQKMLGDLKEE